MERKPVISSNINSIGYDEQSSILEVEFNSGRIYQYFNVPKVIYIALMSASSHGTYFNQNVRTSFSYKRIV